MPARPSTSSGPSSNKSTDVKPGWDKRISKDDIALTRTGMGTGSSLHPSARSGEIPIGMALGSPTQVSASFSVSPQPGWWQPQTQTSVQTSHDHSPPSVQSSHGHPPPSAQTPEPTIQRSKTQKRRLFTSLFGSRKHTESSKTVGSAEADRGASPSPATGSKATPTPVRSNTVASKKTPKHKPIIIKSMAEPGTDADATLSRAPTVSESTSSASTSGTGLLNVEIPDIRLERYSVMFSGVLNSGESKSSLLERRQATLEKLKTISDRIEHQERDDKTRPRRATSPQPMKSPAFSLFPQTPNRQSVVIATTAAGMASTTSLAPPCGLTRSNTSPACLPSPSRANFESPPQPLPEQPKKEKKTVTIVSPRTMDERTRAALAERLREQQAQQQQAQRNQQARSQPRTTAPSAKTLHFHPNGSSLVLDSPPHSAASSSSSTSSTGTESYSPPAYRPALKPNLPEPEWEIITSPSSTSAASPSSSSAKASEKTTPPRPNTRSPSASSSSIVSRTSLDTLATSTSTGTARISVDEEDAALKAAVEISIARQISISRQQRRLLKPFVRAGAGGSGVSPGAKDKNGAGPSSKPDQLTVGVIKGKVMPIMVGPGAAGDRRSERVVLDVAE
ncbi:hypothetical protein VTG60DRAFT_2787 [Thermothelomyces hinnuleus]